MNSFQRGLLMAGLLGVAGAAQAQFSSTVTTTTDYDFRGFTQTAKDAALQAGLDYAFENGLAVGAWASNVDFGNDADIELDLYASFTKAINDTMSWTTGINWYTYPSSDDALDYPEVFVGLDIGPVSLKQWYSNDFWGMDASAWYTEGNASIALSDSLSLLLHAGYSYGPAWDDMGEDVFDFSIGLGYTFNHIDFSLTFTGTDADVLKVKDDVGNNEPRVVFSIATTLPWGQ